MKKVTLLVALLLVFVSISYAEPIITQNEDGVTYDISYQVPDGACFSMCPNGKKSIADVSLEQITFETNTVPTVEIFETNDAKNGILDMTTRTMTFTKIPASLSGHVWNIVIRTKDYEYWVHANPVTYKEKGKTKTRYGFTF